MKKAVDDRSRKKCNDGRPQKLSGDQPLDQYRKGGKGKAYGNAQKKGAPFFRL